MQADGTPAKRHPIRNFIIMPEFQWPYIVRLLALINMASIFMALAVCGIFWWRYGGADAPDGIESVHEGIMGAILQENLLDVLVPAFIVANLVSLGVGLWTALYFSRKISVPIYRVRQWAEIINGGNLAYRLKFRPGDDLQSLEDACNQVSETYGRLIEDLRRKVSEADLPVARMETIKRTLDRLST